MELTPITSNDDAREVLRKVVAEAGMSLTALGERASVGKGSLTRFVHRNQQCSDGTYAKENHLFIDTFIRALDTAGYEVVVRRKVSGSRRERRLAAIKQRMNGDAGVRPGQD